MLYKMDKAAEDNAKNAAKGATSCKAKVREIAIDENNPLYNIDDKKDKNNANSPKRPRLLDTEWLRKQCTSQNFIFNILAVGKG